MNILKHSDSNIEVTLTDEDWCGIVGCIRETRERLSDSEILARFGVDGMYLERIMDYFGDVRSHGITEHSCHPPALTIEKVSDDEYRLTMSKQGARIIFRCLETAFQVMGDWEFHIYLGLFPEEVKELSEQFQRIV